MAVERFLMLGAPASATKQFTQGAVDADTSFVYTLNLPSLPWSSGYYHASVAQFSATFTGASYTIDATIMLALDAPPPGEAWPAGDYALEITRIGGYYPNGTSWVMHYTLAEREPDQPGSNAFAASTGAGGLLG